MYDRSMFNPISSHLLTGDFTTVNHETPHLHAATEESVNIYTLYVNVNAHVNTYGVRPYLNSVKVSQVGF